MTCGQPLCYDAWQPVTTRSVEVLKAQLPVVTEESQMTSNNSLELLPLANRVVKARVEKANNYLALVSTTLGILGALGTVFVWLASNFYVGDVVVETSKPIDGLVVHAYDNKGQEAVFHTSRFQLMPGNYHLEICAGSALVYHKDLAVKFREKSMVLIDLQDKESSTALNDRYKKNKMRWWQFWRKN